MSHHRSARSPRPGGRPRLAALAPVVVAVAVVAGCSSTPVSGVADGPPVDLGTIVDQRAQDDATIVIADNVYQPRAVQVSPGATVTFRNEGANVHNATPNEDGSFGAVSIAPGEAATVTAPTTPGTYRFFCTLHASKDGGLQRGAFVVG